ncbi:MAG: LL-diaminopimelate aminotransferase [Spirochaetales bacterium]|nr:LL-diaminopimelate aminotransferase [Spirochaetales bacterium]
MNILKNIAERLGGSRFGRSTEIYKFEKIKRAKKQAVLKNPDLPLIDMGVGEPDEPADNSIVDALYSEAGKSENRFYADNGILEFQEAAAAYLKSEYNVGNMNPFTNILHGIGSKPILALLPLCLINPGDYTITTTPGYPIHATYTTYLGGKVYKLPLVKESNYLPRLAEIPKDVLSKAKMLYLNYPNNPTGAVANRDFFKEVVEFAHKNNIVVVHDAAYAALVYDNYKPLSFLSVEGASQVGVEVHSLSKAFNMTGWRIAFIAGNETLVKAYGTVKDNTDSGQFRAIQKAGIQALKNTHITKQICEKYSRRFDLLVDALKDVGFDAEKPKGSFYCYVPIPRGTAQGVRFESAEQTAEYLLTQALISAVPWDDAGSFLRLSVTFEADDVDEEKIIINELKQRLKALHLVFS